jgi:uncharacterized membrane protein YraQ (UPF0718 family)
MMLKIFTILADLITYRWLGMVPGTHLGEALHFFVEDTAKIFFLLITIIFAVAIVRSFFPPERTRRFLSDKKLWAAHVLAALLGVVTPFCSCSACPLFIGFVEAGIPLGVTFSFLISSPMVNEVALVLLFGLFGWKVAALYLGTGLVIAVIAGMIIGRLNMERFVADYVWQIRMGEAEIPTMTWRERIEYAKGYVREILSKIWLYVLGGIAVGALVHGYVPQDFLLRYAGPSNPVAVPVAVALGVPLYSNAAGVIPIVQALMDKGLPLGTTLAFMMAVTALSFPEMVILSQVLKRPLIAVFVGVVSVSIMVVGYIFNAVM